MKIQEKNKYFLRRKLKIGSENDLVLSFLMLVFLSGTIYNWSYENVHRKSTRIPLLQIVLRA